MPQDAGIPLARGAEELDDNARQDGGLQQSPALIEQDNAWPSGYAGRPVRGRMRDEQAHGAFQARIVLQFLDIEVEPWVVQFDGCRPVEETRIRSLIHPGPQLGRGHLCHRVDLLVAVPVLPVRQFRRQVAKQRDWIRSLRTATLVG